MAPSATKSRSLLPDEQFWKRYSPHHEFPLSTVASVGIHLIGFGLLAMIGYAVFSIVRDADKPIATRAVALAEEPSGGGGGRKDGAGNAPGVGDPAEDAVPTPPDRPENPVAPTPEKTEFDKVDRSALKLDSVADPTTQRLVEEGGRQVDAIAGLAASARKRLGVLAGEGKGGPGKGGGDGTGRGKSGGSGVGDGTGDGASVRERRILRWTLIFNTRDGSDYARQLAAFDAILAIPDPKNEENYLVIRDLQQRPARPRVEDISEIKRIFWIDDKRASVQSLAIALQLKPVPRHIVAFFPPEFEEKLLRLELNFRGNQEEDITETRFDVFRSGGTYDVRVISQR